MKINKQAVQKRQAKPGGLERANMEQDRRFYQMKKKRLQNRLYPLAK